MDSLLFLHLEGLGGSKGLMGLGRAVMCVSEVSLPVNPGSIPDMAWPARSVGAERDRKA